MRHDSSTGHWIRLPGKGRRRALPFTAAAAAVVLVTGITAVAVTRTAPANAAAVNGRARLRPPPGSLIQFLADEPCLMSTSRTRLAQKTLQHFAALLNGALQQLPGDNKTEA